MCYVSLKLINTVNILYTHKLEQKKKKKCDETMECIPFAHILLLNYKIFLLTIFNKNKNLI